METIRALIQRIQEQSDRQAPPGEILVTVNALQSALQDAVAENVKKIKSANISVVMPSANRNAGQTSPVQQSSEAVGWRVKQKPQADPEAERFVAANASETGVGYSSNLQQASAPEVPAKGALASGYTPGFSDDEAVIDRREDEEELTPTIAGGIRNTPVAEPGDWEKKPTPWQEPVRPGKNSLPLKESPVNRPEPKESTEVLQDQDQPVKWQPAPPQELPAADEPWKPKKPEDDLHAGYKPASPKPSTQQEIDLRERNDIFSQSASLNDRHRPEHEEIGSALNDEPVKDLRRAIGINDRFVFLSELFRGDEVMYERSLKTINNFRIYPEAEYWIERELKVKLGWDENKAAVKQFRHLVRRRFQNG